MRFSLRSRVMRLSNDKQSINALFTVRLICAAALLSFAHCATDVAHAVGPLAAIADTALHSEVSGSAVVTVIIAPQLGLPVSSTHIELGGVFGVGFLREFIKTSYGQMLEEIRAHHINADKDVVEAFVTRFERASVKEKRDMLDQLKARTVQATLSKQERKQMRKVYPIPRRPH